MENLRFIGILAYPKTKPPKSKENRFLDPKPVITLYPELLDLISFL
jgi:hypothetical protein